MWTDLYEKIRRFYRASLKPAWQTMLASRTLYAPMAGAMAVLTVLFCLPFFIGASSEKTAALLGDAYVGAIAGGSGSFSAVLRHLSGGSHMLTLLGLCLWFPLALCVLNVVFHAELETGKFVHGLYITFGADTHRLVGLICLQFVSLCAVLVLPSWLITGLLCALCYGLFGFTCAWSFGSLLLAFPAMMLLTWLCIWVQAKMLVRTAPVRLLSAADVSDYVSSPKKSADITGGKQPLRLFFLGFLRMRRHYIPLCLLCSICASLALGVYSVGQGARATTVQEPAFTFSVADGLSPRDEESLTQTLSAMPGVCRVTVPGRQAAADIGSHLLFWPGQTDGIGCAAAETRYRMSDVTVWVANELSNEALGFTYDPVARGCVTVILPTSGPAVSLDLEKGARLTVGGYSEDGDAQTPFLTLTVTFIHRRGNDGIHLLLHPWDYAELVAPGTVTKSKASPVSFSDLSVSSGVVLALPESARDLGFVPGETVTFHTTKVGSSFPMEKGAYLQIKNMEEILHGTAAENGLTEDYIETTVADVLPYEGTSGDGLLLFSAQDARFAAWKPPVENAPVGVISLQRKDDVLYCRNVKAFAVALTGGGDLLGENISIGSRPDPGEIVNARLKYNANPTAGSAVSDNPDVAYGHIRFYAFDTVTVGDTVWTVGFNRPSNSFTPILNYEDVYVMPRGDAMCLRHADLFPTDDVLKNQKYVTPVGRFVASNDWDLQQDAALSEGEAVLTLPRGCSWQVAPGDFLHAAVGQRVNLKKYVEDVTMLTQPLVLLETQLQYVDYLYHNLSVTSVIYADVDRPLLTVNPVDAATVAGRGYLNDTVQVFADDSAAPEMLGQVVNCLSDCVASYETTPGDGSASFSSAAWLWDQKVFCDGGFPAALALFAVLLLLLIPFASLFTQLCHFRKRRDEYDLLFGIGKSDAEITAVMRCEAVGCGTVTAMLTALLNLPVCRCCQLFLGLPDVPLSQVRVGVLPFLAVSVIAGVCVGVVTFICAHRVHPAYLQKGGSAHGHS